MDFPPSFPVFLLSHPQEMHSLLCFFAFSTSFFSLQGVPHPLLRSSIPCSTFSSLPLSRAPFCSTLFFAPLYSNVFFSLSVLLHPLSHLYPLPNVFFSPSALFCALSLFFLLFSANFTFIPLITLKKWLKRWLVYTYLLYLQVATLLKRAPA